MQATLSMDTFIVMFLKTLKPSFFVTLIGFPGGVHSINALGSGTVQLPICRAWYLGNSSTGINDFGTSITFLFFSLISVDYTRKLIGKAE